MRTDAIDLHIGTTSLRVVCDDPEGATMLRSALADHLADEPAPVGFALRLPRGPGGLHVVLDRSGHVLARVRTVEEGVAVLGSHLEALLLPPNHTVRLRARGFLGGDGTVALVVSPLLVGVPVVERRLQRASLRVIDRLVADIGADATVSATAAQWPTIGAQSGVAGHAPAPESAAPVRTVIVPQIHHEAPSRADLVALLASVALPGTPHADRLAAADRLTSTQVEVVRMGDSTALYAALEG